MVVLEPGISAAAALGCLRYLKKESGPPWGGGFLKENKHKTLRFTVFYAPEGSETLVKRNFLIS